MVMTRSSSCSMSLLSRHRRLRRRSRCSVMMLMHSVLQVMLHIVSHMWGRGRRWYSMVVEHHWVGRHVN